MHVETIESSSQDVRHLAARYHDALSQKDRAIAEAVAQIEEGARVIDLRRALEAAPTDEKGRIRFAVARADRGGIEVEQIRDRHGTTYSTQGQRGREGRDLFHQFDLPWRGHDPWSVLRGYATVPHVPPDIRYEVGATRLPYLRVLWEVEEWRDSPRTQRFDRDPLLLQPIVGDLHLIVAQWDVSPLEAALLEAAG